MHIAIEIIGVLFGNIAQLLCNHKITVENTGNKILVGCNLPELLRPREGPCVSAVSVTIVVLFLSFVLSVILLILCSVSFAPPTKRCLPGPVLIARWNGSSLAREGSELLLQPCDKSSITT